jgi:hypothetical protein
LVSWQRWSCLMRKNQMSKIWWTVPLRSISFHEVGLIMAGTKQNYCYMRTL